MARYDDDGPDEGYAGDDRPRRGSSAAVNRLSAENRRPSYEGDDEVSIDYLFDSMDKGLHTIKEELTNLESKLAPYLRMSEPTPDERSEKSPGMSAGRSTLFEHLERYPRIMEDLRQRIATITYLVDR